MKLKFPLKVIISLNRKTNMMIRNIILLLFITSSLFAQDTVKSDNKWFTEFQIANSSGFTLDLLNGADLAIGRRIIKNIDLRIVGGFNTDDGDRNAYGIGISSIDKSTYYRYNLGFDILYRIKIVKDLLFKTGIGYEYYFWKSNFTRNSSYNSIGESGYQTDQSERKSYENHFRAVGSFNYSFTNNIYAFVQVYLTYADSHGTEYQTSYRNYNGKEYTNSYSYDNKNNTFNADNLILGGGISF